MCCERVGIWALEMVHIMITDMLSFMKTICHKVKTKNRLLESILTQIAVGELHLAALV